MNNNSSSGRACFFDVLGIVFIVLKLIGAIKWSWWLVLAPIYVPIVLIIAVIILSLFK